MRGEELGTERTTSFKGIPAVDSSLPRRVE
jgi:hypothetical protein